MTTQLKPSQWPAFPTSMTFREGELNFVKGEVVPEGKTQIASFHGHSLRTHVATAAMQGILASGPLNTAAGVAHAAVKQADALLKELGIE